MQNAAYGNGINLFLGRVAGWLKVEIGACYSLHYEL